MKELEAVIQQAETGDHKAFGIIVQRFQDMAVGYAFSILGDFHLAEDAAQEAFVQAFYDLPQLRDPSAFPSWFRRLIFKQCDRLTRRKRGRHISLDDTGELFSSEPGPLRKTEEHEMNELIHEAIRELPEHERRVVTLFYISDYSQKEIAGFLDVSISTVKKRLFDARKRLKKRMITMVQENLHENRPSKDNQFLDTVLELIAPNQEEHSEGIYTLFELTGHSLDPSAASEWRQGRMSHSSLDWDTSRIGVIDNQVVSACGIYDITMRIGTARVRTAGINLDAVHPDYQAHKQGLMEKTVHASIQAMREQGYDLSVTFGNEKFFSNLGYVFGWRQLQWYVNVDELPSEEPEFEVHEFTPEHRKDLAELYNEWHEKLTGTAIKPTYLKDKHPGTFRGWLWTDIEGKAVGYISGDSDAQLSLDTKFQNDLDQGRITSELRKKIDEKFTVRGPLGKRAICAVQSEGSRWLIVDGKRKHLILRTGDKLSVYLRERGLFWVDECAGDPEQILKVLGLLAHKSNCEAVFFDRLHYKSALGKRLRRMTSCQIEPDSWGGLSGSTSYVVRIVNLKSSFDKLAPELSRRLRISPLADWHGNVLVSDGHEQVTLAIESGEVRIVSPNESEHQILGGPEIAQLIVGTETPDEIVEMNNIRLVGRANQLIEVLFPMQYPQMENQAL